MTRVTAPRDNMGVITIREGDLIKEFACVSIVHFDVDKGKDDVYPYKWVANKDIKRIKTKEETQ